MQYKVIHKFIDKNTRELFNEGSLYFCDNEERATELITNGFIEKPKQEKKVRQSRKKASDE